MEQLLGWWLWGTGLGVGMRKQIGGFRFETWQLEALADSQLASLVHSECPWNVWLSLQISPVLFAMFLQEGRWPLRGMKLSPLPWIQTSPQRGPPLLSSLSHLPFTLQPATIWLPLPQHHWNSLFHGYQWPPEEWDPIDLRSIPSTGVKLSSSTHPHVILYPEVVPAELFTMEIPGPHGIRTVRGKNLFHKHSWSTLMYFRITALS